MKKTSLFNTICILLLITITIITASCQTNQTLQDPLNQPNENEQYCTTNQPNSNNNTSNCIINTENTEESTANPPSTTQTTSTGDQETITPPPEYGQLQTDYTLLEIENNLNQVVSESLAYHTTSEFPGIIFGNARKSAIIIQEQNSIGDYEEFLNTYAQPNFNLEKIYLNTSIINTLHAPLTQKDTNHFQDYKDTKNLILRIEKEQSFDLNNGKVLEYQLQYLKTDEFNNYKGLYLPSLIIYKVYCGPHATILLKPDWIETERSATGTIEDAKNNFQDEVSHLRQDMLSKSDKLLKKCPVTYSFFEEMQDINKESTSTLAYNRRIYWERQANVDINAEIKVKNMEYRNSSNIERIKFTIQNNDPYSIRDELYVDIIAKTDSNQERSIVSNKQLTTQGINSQEILVRDYFPEYDVEYSNTVKLKILVHRTKDIENIKPILITFNRLGEIIEEEPIQY